MQYGAPSPARPQSGVDFGIISEAFAYLTAHWTVYCTAGGVIMLAGLPGNIISFFPVMEMFGSNFRSPFDAATSNLIQYALIIPAFCVITCMEAGITKYTLNVRKGQPYSQSDLWEGFRDPLGYCWAGFLATIVGLLGLIACCVGAFVTTGLMMFVIPVKVDRGMTGSDSVSESWQMLKGEWFMAAVFLLVISIISGLGYLACFIGIIFTLPLMNIAQTLLYCNYMGYTPEQQTQSVSPYPRSGQPGYSMPPPRDIGEGTVQPPDMDERPEPPGQDPLRPNRP